MTPPVSRRAIAAFALVLAAVPAAWAESAPRVKLNTSLGDIVVEVYPDKAPKTAANFLQYVRDKHYDGTIFHRVIPGFMIQGGGFVPGMQQKGTDAAIENEARNGLKNQHYTVAMARTSDPHSATAQFFINVADNGFLNHTAPSGQGWGYAVFGKVVQGMEVIDKIAALPTRGQGPFAADVPNPLPVIESVRVIGEQAPAPAASTREPTATPKPAQRRSKARGA